MSRTVYPQLRSLVTTIPVILCLSTDPITDMPVHRVLIGKFFQAPATMRNNSNTLATMGKAVLLSLPIDGALVAHVCFRNLELPHRGRGMMSDIRL